jgi:multiple sugar transport system permease protein
MPLIKPTLACISIFTFMAVWNDFMGPLIYLSDQRLYPLSLGLYAFNVQAGSNLGMMMAGSLLMTVPVIVIFFFAQKYFIQGVTLTGIKG